MELLYLAFEFLSGYSLFAPWLNKQEWTRNMSPIVFRIVALICMLLLVIVLWLIISISWFYGDRLFNLMK